VAERIKIKIFRFDPDLDQKGRLVEYSLEKVPGMRILGALKAFNERGANIAFRYSCEEWQCGSCSILVNGAPRLACKEEVQNDMVLEPLPDLPVLKDLIADRTKFYQKQAELYQLPGSKTGIKLDHKSQMDMWDSITCMECDICLASCPILHTTGKSYDYIGPEFMVSLFRYEADPRIEKKSLETSAKSGIWECTTCKYCEENCPQRIPVLQAIIELRSRILEERPTHLPITVRDVNTNLYKHHNPYGTPKLNRANWAKGLDIADIREESKENLYFVGCAQCSNQRDQEVARAMVDVFNKANVDFGFLGRDEACCGDVALRTGELGLFEEIAIINIENFQKCNVAKIVTTSPHCYHVIKNEYPKYGGDFEVLHYTQFVEELIEKGQLTFSRSIDKAVTFHDPCFLGRYNDLYESPRKILKAIPVLQIVEMAKSREQAECCGGGGGGCWMDIRAGERLSERRITQAVETGARILAVACPFCLAMFEDAVKTKAYDEKIEVKHIVELVMQAM